MHFWENENICPHKNVHTNGHSIFTHTASEQKTLQCPPTEEMLKRCSLHIRENCVEQSPYTRYSVGERQKHAEFIKLVTNTTFCANCLREMFKT